MDLIYPCILIEYYNFGIINFIKNSQKVVACKFVKKIFVFSFTNSADPDWFTHVCWYNKFGIIHFIIYGHM